VSTEGSACNGSLPSTLQSYSASYGHVDDWTGDVYGTETGTCAPAARAPNTTYGQRASTIEPAEFPSLVDRIE